MTFKPHPWPLLAVAAIMTAGAVGSADAASLPHRTTGRSGCEQVREVIISSARQAAALRFWTPRRMAAVRAPTRAALAGLARLAAKGARSADPPEGSFTSVCGRSAQVATAQARADGRQNFGGYPSVGKLFFEGDGVLSETCTAAVIDSGGKEQPAGGTMLILTAAHCIEGTLLRFPYYSTDFAFVPDWRKGSEPYGTWSIQKYYVYHKWLECPLPPIDCHTDPIYDYAIMIVAPRKGLHIGAVTGANGWAEPVPGNVDNVRIVGYPAGSAVPLLSVTNTVAVTENGISYRRGHTPGFGDGSSGGPWFNSIQSAGVGVIIADTGGYQQGGDSPTPSYADIWSGTFADLVGEASRGE
jgi:hypothetical protein